MKIMRSRGRKALEVGIVERKDLELLRLRHEEVLHFFEFGRVVLSHVMALGEVFGQIVELPLVVVGRSGPLFGPAIKSR
jgi:hypothetical protein